jgi:N-hydroxyarylamine O-acetyltransferase
MHSVPFENLDIARGRPIILEEALLFEKIVPQRRGGFCYENNGLFAWLLRQLGFQVTVLSARVFDGPAPGPEFDHMCLLVHLEERWLADVGFGDCFHEPLRLDESNVQERNGTLYRVAPGAERWQLWENKGEWMPAYDFTLQPRHLSDFAEMCRYQQTSPNSIFTQKRVCTLARPTGRITLSNQRLIINENGVRTEREVSDAEYDAILREQFGISFD